MAAEDQVLNFVFKVNTKSLNLGFEDAFEDLEDAVRELTDSSEKWNDDIVYTLQNIEASMTDWGDRMADTLDDISDKISDSSPDGGKGFGEFTDNLEKQSSILAFLKPRTLAYGGALGVVFGLVAKNIKDWAKFHLTMDRLRRSTGLTQVETAEFSSEVISATAKYGVALDKVQTVAVFMAKGAKNATTEVAALASELANLADAGEVNAETQAQLGSAFRRFGRMTEREVLQNIHAVQATARDAKIPAEDLTKMLLGNIKTIRAHGRAGVPKMIESMSAIGTALYRVHGPILGMEEFNSLMSRVEDSTDPLSIELRKGAKGFSDFFKGLAQNMDEYGDVQFAEAFGITKEVVKAYRDMTTEVDEAGAVFRKNVVLNPQEIRNQTEEALGPWKRFARSFEKIGGGIKATFQQYFGEDSFWYSGLDDLSRFVDKKAGQISYALEGMDDVVTKLLKGAFFTEVPELTMNEQRVYDEIQRRRAAGLDPYDFKPSDIGAANAMPPAAGAAAFEMDSSGVIKAVNEQKKATEQQTTELGGILLRLLRSNEGAGGTRPNGIGSGSPVLEGGIR